jgi:hypothetical protein
MGTNVSEGPAASIFSLVYRMDAETSHIPKNTASNLKVPQSWRYDPMADLNDSSSDVHFREDQSALAVHTVWVFCK